MEFKIAFHNGIMKYFSLVIQEISQNSYLKTILKTKKLEISSLLSATSLEEHFSQEQVMLER